MQKYMVLGLSLLAATLSGCMPSATFSSSSSTPATNATAPAAPTPAMAPGTPPSASNPVSSTPTPPVLASGDNVTLQILAFNDYHGNLLPSTYRYPNPNSPSESVTVQAGGVEALSTLLKTTRAGNPNTVTVGAGDLISASPLVSSLLADEPSVVALNTMGLEFSSVGNHEFDRGFKELLRVQKGGCDGVDPTQTCKFENTFSGAKYTYLAANVLDKATGKPALPAYAIKTFADFSVAFVGAVLKSTPTIVSPAGVSSLEFTDEADAVNKLIPEIKAKGVSAIVLLIHQGGNAIDPFYVQDCKTLSGDILAINKKLDPAVDLIVSGHTHRGYNCRVDGRLITQAGSYGYLLSNITLQIDKKNKKVLSSSAETLLVDSTKIAKDPAMTAIVSKAKTLTDAVAGRVIAKLGVEQIKREAKPNGESALGDVIADSQLAATKPGDKGGSSIALMNPGGIRADLPPNVPNPSSSVTYGDAFTVQPFGNSLVVLSLSAAQIKAVLEQQFDNPSAGQNRILQVSDGFTYTWDNAKPKGEKVDPSSIKLNGNALNPAAIYRVTVNNFLADGGDGFTALKEGNNRLGGGQDIDAFAAYLKAQSDAGKPLQPGAVNRITRVN